MSTVTEWIGKVAPDDALESVPVAFDGSAEVSFTLPPGWNVGLASKDPYDLTEAMLHMDGVTYHLSRAVIERLAIAFGLTPRYLARTPGPLVASHLNYWATHSPDTTVSLLVDTGQSQARAVVKKALTVFPNTPVLETATQAVVLPIEKPVTSWEVVDDLSFHTLDQTMVRLTSAETGGIVLETARADDDRWVGGIQLSNSLTGRHVTGVDGFLYSMDFGHGLITTHAVAHYNRRAGHDAKDVLEWIPGAMVGVVEALPYELDVLTALVDRDVLKMDKVLANIFRNYQVPLRVRRAVIGNIEEFGDETYYAIVVALSQAANLDNLNRAGQTAMIQIAGSVAHDFSHMCTNCQQVIL